MLWLIKKHIKVEVKAEVVVILLKVEEVFKKYLYIEVAFMLVKVRKISVSVLYLRRISICLQSDTLKDKLKKQQVPQ